MSEKEKPQDPIWTILPSYYMYHLTFSGELDPPEYQEHEVEEPDDSSKGRSYPSSVVPTSITSYTRTSETADGGETGSSESSFIVADENTTSWRETILDNINELRNLSDGDNTHSNAVKISIHFTKDVGQRGVKPELIDPSLHEYKQDDFLNGYLLINNEGPHPIPFDMFYVLFEGNFIIADKNDSRSKTPVKFRKFLEMFDFAASWNPASVDRLLTDDSLCNCDVLIDPVDNSRLCIGPEKTLAPNTLFKRFFTFRIPTRLLDSECNDHNLPGHTELPPTLGLSRDERFSWVSKDPPIDDMSFVDTSISYSVRARFIGKAHKYGADVGGGRLINAKGEEFVILKERCSYIRILQESTLLSDCEREINNETSRILFSSFLSQVKERIAVGEELKKALESGDKDINLQPCIVAAEEAVRSRDMDDDVKARQLYTRCNLVRDVKSSHTRPDNYTLTVPITKKVLFGRPKALGTVTVTTPKIGYSLSYLSPKRFRSTDVAVDASSWKLSVPVKLSFTLSSIINSESVTPPEISSIYGELVAFTIKSINRPIPIELNHDFLFKNEPAGEPSCYEKDDFYHLVQLPVQKYAGQLYKLFNTLGTENFPVQRGLVEDVSALARMERKANKLVLNDIQWDGCKERPRKNLVSTWRKADSQTYTKEISIDFDVSKAQKKALSLQQPSQSYKAYDEFTLVPSFQTCLMSRLYYIQLTVKFTSKDVVRFKVPVTIVKT